jgi:hypothetical protein
MLVIVVVQPATPSHRANRDRDEMPNDETKNEPQQQRQLEAHGRPLSTLTASTENGHLPFKVTGAIRVIKSHRIKGNWDQGSLVILGRP